MLLTPSSHLATACSGSLQVARGKNRRPGYVGGRNLGISAFPGRRRRIAVAIVLHLYAFYEFQPTITLPFPRLYLPFPPDHGIHIRIVTEGCLVFFSKRSLRPEPFVQLDMGLCLFLLSVWHAPIHTERTHSFQELG